MIFLSRSLLTNDAFLLPLNRKACRHPGLLRDDRRVTIALYEAMKGFLRKKRTTKREKSEKKEREREKGKGKKGDEQKGKKEREKKKLYSANREKRKERVKR